MIRIRIRVMVMFALMRSLVCWVIESHLVLGCWPACKRLAPETKSDSLYNPAVIFKVAPILSYMCTEYSIIEKLLIALLQIVYGDW